MLNDLDPILHSQVRLAIMSLLMDVKQADFNYLRTHTRAADGNLSVQIQKLKEAKYIEVVKKYRKNYPQTVCTITEKGIQAFDLYAKTLAGYIKKKRT
jgi:predicted transcriptional regulator